MIKLRTLNDLDVTRKVVLVRVDLNVPMKHGKVEDAIRITRLVPTLKELIKRQAKVVVLSHFGRPNGEFVRDMSLAPLTNPLSEALGDMPIKFALDCIGQHTKEAIAAMQPGEIILLENVRFHPGEENNDPAFAKELASLGDCFVNDTLSCSHRTHASIVGIATHLPSAAGLLLQEEMENLERVLEHPETPLAAIVGGSKVSTKLDLLHNLMKKVQLLAIGGAMANTFLKAAGYPIGNSLYEEALVPTAHSILHKAHAVGCEIFLPRDVVVAKEFRPQAPCQVVPVQNIPADSMVLDIGPESIAELSHKLADMRSLVWNGPLGAFEMQPFDVGTISLARRVASLTRQKRLVSVAGGGDIVAALKVGGLIEEFTYISTAGGAFLEWLEGKELPGLMALRDVTAKPRSAAVK